jgi:DNA-directed RNA polymerase subunit RPC12/RpoP
MLTKVFCDICNSHIADVNAKKLSIPIDPQLFKSIMPGRAPDPFIVAKEWLDIRCPYCRKRPFIEPDEIVLDYKKTKLRKRRERTDT